MFNFEFLITPIGLIILIATFLLAIMHVLSSSRSLKDLKTTRTALLDEAKQRSLRSFSIVTSISDSAAELLPLIQNLSNQKYEQLQLVVFVNPSVKRGTLSLLRTYRKDFPVLNICIISGRKSISDMQIARKYASGDYMMKISPDQKLTPQFFTASSYALISSPSALRIRTIVRPESTLTNGFYSLLSLWSSLIQYVSKKSLSGKKLNTGVLIDRVTLSKNRSYISETVMYEEFAIEISRQDYKKGKTLSFVSAFSILTLLAVGIAALTFAYSVTPLSIFLTSLAVLGAAYIVSSSLLLLNQKGLTLTDRLVLFTLIPFYPFWICIVMITKSIAALSAHSYTMILTKHTK